MVDELKVVGKSVPRLDAYEKATGAAEYAGDMRQYGMLYGKILRSPYAHARVVKIDISRAVKLEGVKAILTYKDIPLVWFGEVFGEDAQVLPDKVRFWGDEVLAVAADSEEIAEIALEMIDVKYEKLPIALSVEEALKPEATLIPPPEFSSSNLLKIPSRTFIQERGNVDEGFKEADRVFEDTYKTTFVQHIPIEPRACLVRWDNEILNVWVCTQTPFEYRRTIAKVLEIPENRVRINSVYTGGGFGGKHGGRYAIIAALLAKKTGRPVLLRFTREEEMLSKLRHASDTRIKLGLKEDGSFTAIAAEITTASGGYNWSLNTAGVLPTTALFRSPHARHDSRSVYTNHPYTGEMRGVDNLLITFGLCQTVDRVAEELGLDPIEFIKKTHIQPGDPCESKYGKPGVTLSTCGLDECLDKGAAAIGWQKKWKGYKTPVQVNGRKRTGMGVTPMTHHSSPEVFTSGAIVVLNMDGTAQLLTPVTEIGQGAKTTQAQVLAEASGIPLRDIHVINADTAVTPMDPWGQVASTSAHLQALATKLAGEDAKHQLLERVAEEWELNPMELDISDGNIFVTEKPERAITIKELMTKTPFGVISVIGSSTVRCPTWPKKARHFGAHFAEVEVDTETGEVAVLKYVAAHDVGRAINPQVVEGQIEGGVVMGLGMALTEKLTFDDDGIPLNLNLTDYKIFTASDIPEITSIIVESDDPLGPYGAKGLGEAPNIPVQACIANAIYNAIGIRFKELPITPEKVLKALKQSR